jgi:YhcH/YjgK/YiaL family protein
VILSSLDQADRYAGLHPLFPLAFAWGRDPVHHSLPTGRHSIVGDDLVALMNEGSTAPAAVKALESHRRFIDIQLVLAGPEIMEWAPLAGLTITEAYDATRDIAFHADPAAGTARLLVHPGQFAVFWPDDAHKPCCDPGSVSVQYRKIIFKVAVRD